MAILHDLDNALQSPDDHTNKYADFNIHTHDKFILGIDLGANLGVAQVFPDGSGAAHTIKLDTDLNARLRGVAAVIRQHAVPECLGACIEEPFGANPNGAKPLYAMMGAAVLAAEEAGLPWSLINLSKLKKHATGKGNASKPEMIEAAGKRFGLVLDENAADAIHAAAYAMDTGLFS